MPDQLAERAVTEGEFKANDGVVIRYVETGAGKPIVLVHGWSHSGKLFAEQLKGLADRYRVLAIDLRGHGTSGKAKHGMRLSRLAKDLHEFFVALDLRDVTVLGHGMGAAILWCYWDTFGSDRIAKMIFVDMSPFATANPIMNDEEKKLAGTTFDLKNLYSEVNAVAGINGGAVAEALTKAMVSRQTPRETIRNIVTQDLKTPRDLAAALLYNWATHDWRDTIPRIDVPVLAIGAKGSPVPYESQVWISRQIPGAQSVIFDADEGGSHFMFLENPEKFNAAVAQFVG